MLFNIRLFYLKNFFYKIFLSVLAQSSRFETKIDQIYRTLKGCHDISAGGHECDLGATQVQY